jgi:hypothetical protein
MGSQEVVDVDCVGAAVGGLVAVLVVGLVLIWDAVVFVSVVWFAPEGARVPVE